MESAQTKERGITMKMSELAEQARQEITEEQKTGAVEIIKESLRELDALERALATAKGQHVDLLSKDINDVV